MSIALSLPSNGKLYAIDKDKKNTDVAINFFKQAKVNKKINVEVNNALVVLKNLKKKKKKFDLILIDADKENYINYFNLSLSLINKDGIILVDNILWKGEVANPSSKDKITMKIKEFNKHIKNKNINKLIFIPLSSLLYFHNMQVTLLIIVIYLFIKNKFKNFYIRNLEIIFMIY